MARPEKAPSPQPRRRMSAENRKAAIVAAAVAEFAQHGYEGTATEAIAARAGVSQPYLFQLFGNKRDLFIATVREAFARTFRAFETAALAVRGTDPSPEAALHAMGAAYCDLLADRDLLRCQLNAYAACSDDVIRAAVRAEFAGLYRNVAEISGADAAVLDLWFARGMLMNTVAALAPDLTEEGEDLSLTMLTPVEGMPAAPSRTANDGRAAKDAFLAAKAENSARKARSRGRRAPTPKARSRTQA